MQLNYNPVDKNSKEYLIRCVQGGRYAILMILVFTAVNLITVLLNVGQFFLFSASVPYYMTLLAKGMDNGFAVQSWSINGRFTLAAVLISAGILAAYLLCWLTVPKRKAGLMVALVMFSADTAALVFFSLVLYGSLMNSVMDLFIHGWAIWQMTQAVRFYGKMKETTSESD